MFVSAVKHFFLFKLLMLFNFAHHVEKCSDKTLFNSLLSLLRVVCLSHCSIPVQLLKSSDLGRHSLLYLKEIGHGWFGKVADACLTQLHCAKLQFSKIVGIGTALCLF